MRVVFCLILLCLPVAAPAGPLADALSATEDGVLYFEFETRPDVRGDGRSLSIGDRDDWHGGLEDGPGRVWMRVRRGEVTDIDLEVGGRRPRLRERTSDLGEIDAVEVREVMLHLAESTDDRDLDTAIVCAMVTRGFDDWPRLLAIARDPDRPGDVRESSIFWLGQGASEVATEGLAEIVDDEDEELEIREHAIFALSQLDTDVAFPALREVALNSRHPQLRRTAFFWLSQHDDDERVLELFEEVLLR